MSKRRKQSQSKPWQPLQRAAKIPPGPERIELTRRVAVEMGLDPDKVQAELERDVEVWQNDRYTVIVKRDVPRIGDVEHLSIRRNDRAAEPFPWRDLQRIKTQLAGAETEAVELFPAESRLLDTANQRWLWCLRPGDKVPVGFDIGRQTADPETAELLGAKQDALEED